MGDYAQGTPYQRALSIWEKVLGPERGHRHQPEQLAGLYDAWATTLGRSPSTSALWYHGRRWPEHPVTAGSLNALAFLDAMGDYARAEPVSACPRHLGEGAWPRARTATSLNNWPSPKSISLGPSSLALTRRATQAGGQPTSVLHLEAAHGLQATLNLHPTRHPGPALTGGRPALQRVVLGSLVEDLRVAGASG